MLRLPVVARQAQACTSVSTLQGCIPGRLLIAAAPKSVQALDTRAGSGQGIVLCPQLGRDLLGAQLPIWAKPLGSIAAARISSAAGLGVGT